MDKKYQEIAEKFDKPFLISEIPTIKDQDILGIKIVYKPRHYDVIDERCWIGKIQIKPPDYNLFFMIETTEGMDIDIDMMYNWYINSEPNKEIVDIDDSGEGEYFISIYHVKEEENGSENSN